MRLFWAVTLPDPHKAAAMEVQARLRQADPRAPVKWVAKDELHLTIKFLGDAEQDAPMVESVRAAAARVAPFELVLGSAGSFGGGRPRILWLGVKGPGQVAAKGLADAVEAACLPHGFPREERDFHAHVTLGRVQQGRGNLASLRDALRRAVAPAALPPLVVKRVVLFESVLSHGRPPVYTERATVELGGGVTAGEGTKT